MAKKRKKRRRARPQQARAQQAKQQQQARPLRTRRRPATIKHEVKTETCPLGHTVTIRIKIDLESGDRLRATTTTDAGYVCGFCKSIYEVFLNHIHNLGEVKEIENGDSRR